MLNQYHIRGLAAFSSLEGGLRLMNPASAVLRNFYGIPHRTELGKQYIHTSESTPVSNFCYIMILSWRACEKRVEKGNLQTSIVSCQIVSVQRTNFPELKPYELCDFKIEFFLSVDRLRHQSMKVSRNKKDKVENGWSVCLYVDSS